MTNLEYRLLRLMGWLRLLGLLCLASAMVGIVYFAVTSSDQLTESLNTLLGAVVGAFAAVMFPIATAVARDYTEFFKDKSEK